MKTILLADDEENLRLLVRTTLDDPQCRIIEAADGASALELARRELPDVIVLDWMMPGMTGVEVARELRRAPETAGIPVILLTARGQDADRDVGLATGACAYLVKPFSPLELLEKVEELTRTSASDVPEPSPEVRREIDHANSQLALYARDLKRIAGAERRKAKELAEANARLRVLDRMKMDFLGFISHELRTPLQVMGAINIVDPGGDPARHAEQLALVRRGYERLEALVRKALDYFAWLGREREETRETTELAKLVTGICREVPGLQADDVEFRLQVAAEPCFVRGERKHLGEVVRVLVDNSLKFSRNDRRIHVSVSRIGNRVVFKIQDNGHGFSPELAREIFRPFTVADVIHHSQGTGLNLALAGAIVHAYGGSIHAESAGLGCGATFAVEFPALAPDEALRQG